MSVDRILMLKLLGDTSSIDKSLKKSQGRLRSYAGAAGSWVKAAGIGIAIEGVSKLGEALGDAWTGFRDGERAAAQLGTTWKNLGLDGSELQGVIDDISASTLKLGTDDTEAINAFNEALQNTGGDSTKAMNRLRIAQDLVASGSAPNLTSALGLIRQAAKGSARVVDRFGLQADTAGGRVKELGRKVRGAAKRAADLDPLGVLFNDIDEALEGIVGSLAKGDLDGALVALQGIGNALATTWGKVGPAVTGVIDKLTGGKFSEFLTWLGQGDGKRLVEKFVEVIDDMAYAWQNLEPVIGNVLTFMQPLFDLFSTTAEGGLGFVLDSVSGVLRTMGDLLTGDFSAAWETAGDTVARLKADIETIVNGIAEFLGEALGGIGETAGKIGAAIFDGIAGAVRNLVAYIARTWNSLGSFGPGSFTFAEAFQFEVLGQTFGWPKLAVSWPGGDIIPNIAIPGGGGRNQLGVPGLAEGGIIRKRPGGMLARIGEGRSDEAVVPLDRHGGIGGNVTINIYAGAGTDPSELGRVVTRALRAYRQGGGRSDILGAIGVG